MKRKAPVGSSWRILAHGKQGKRFDLRSRDYPGMDGPGKDRVPFQTVFDELVIGDVLHVEQMDTNRWWIGVGRLHVNVRVVKGKAEVTWWDDQAGGGK